MKNLLVKLLMCFLVFGLLRCNEPMPEPITNFIQLSEIHKVELNNVRGKHVLNETQLEKFLMAFSKCTTEPNLHIKTGSLTIIFTLKSGKTFVARGTSKSEYLELSADFATQNRHKLKSDWLTLNTNGVNFNNY